MTAIRSWFNLAGPQSLALCPLINSSAFRKKNSLSFTGIVSNITGFTFSEMFDMKNPKFFTQLYGSIRNVVNALGVIDSTVSEKDHILYKQYLSQLEKELKIF